MKWAALVIAISTLCTCALLLMLHGLTAPVPQEPPSAASQSIPAQSLPALPQPELVPEPVPPAFVPLVDYAVAGQALAPVIEQICKDYRTMGMSLAVFDPNSIVYQQSYGYAVAETGQKVDEATRFRIASISKAVSSLLALELWEQGKLDIDADAGVYMGLPLRSYKFPDTPITARMLMIHTSGIFDSSAYYYTLEAGKFAPLEAVLEKSYLGYAPGSYYSYSNLGLGMLGGVMEGATGERFVPYTRRIFEEMGLDAAYSYTELRDKENVANIYDSMGVSANLHQWGNMTALYNNMPQGKLYALAHGDLIISAGGLARIAMIMAGCPQLGESFTLEESTLALMQTVQFEAQNLADYGVTEVKRGVGTHITDHLLEGRRMVGHQGNAYGMISGLFFDPEQKTGFVLLTNGTVGTRNAAGVYSINSQAAKAIYSAFFGYAIPAE